MRRPNRLPRYPYGSPGVTDVINLEDNEKINFGDAKDYSIYFDGTNFVVDSGTHELKIDLDTAAKGKIYGGLATGDDLELHANATDTYPHILMPGNDNVDLKMAGTKQFRLFDTTVLFGVLKRTTWSHTSNVTTGNANLFNFLNVTTTADVVGLEIDASTSLTMGTNFGATGLKITTIAPDGSGVSNDILLTQGASINNITDAICTIYGGDAGGDDLNLRANSSDDYPSIRLYGATDIRNNLSAGYGYKIYEFGTLFLTINRSGSTWITDSATGTALDLGWSTKTTTGNIVGLDIDASTNLTMGTNFGATGLKINVAAPNGSGKSQGIDLSSLAVDFPVFKVVSDPGDTPGTLTGQIAIDVAGTTYYIYYYTTSTVA